MYVTIPIIFIIGGYAACCEMVSYFSDQKLITSVTVSAQIANYPNVDVNGALRDSLTLNWKLKPLIILNFMNSNVKNRTKIIAEISNI